MSFLTKEYIGRLPKNKYEAAVQVCEKYFKFGYFKRSNVTNIVLGYLQGMLADDDVNLKKEKHWATALFSDATTESHQLIEQAYGYSLAKLHHPQSESLG